MAPFASDFDENGNPWGLEGGNLFVPGGLASRGSLQVFWFFAQISIVTISWGAIALTGWMLLFKQRGKPDEEKDPSVANSTNVKGETRQEAEERTARMFEKSDLEDSPKALKKRPTINFVSHGSSEERK